jgi:hypothetical protein
MTVDDERAARTMLADLTAGQPAAPPDRLGAVRRRAVLRRRRQFAAIAAVIAVVAVAAATIPLRLIGSAPPVAPTNYQLSEQPPRPGQGGGLVAIGQIDGRPWRVTLSHETGSAQGRGSGLCIHLRPSPGMSCADGQVAGASSKGDPASVSLGVSLGTQADAPNLELATVRSDVTSMRIRYSNGQVLTLYPVKVFQGPYARYAVIASPRSGSVASVTALAGHRALGYSVPFTGQSAVNVVRWLPSGQPALPRPATRRLGAGAVDGVSWTESASIGPWGTCLYGSGSGTTCIPSVRSELSRDQMVDPAGGISTQYSGGRSQVYIYAGEAARSVSYLIVTLRDRTTVRVSTVALSGRRFFACADGRGNRIVSWAAYDATGHRLASSKPGQIP